MRTPFAVVLLAIILTSVESQYGGSQYGGMPSATENLDRGSKLPDYVMRTDDIESTTAKLAERCEGVDVS